MMDAECDEPPCDISAHVYPMIQDETLGKDSHMGLATADRPVSGHEEERCAV